MCFIGPLHLCRINFLHIETNIFSSIMLLDAFYLLILNNLRQIGYQKKSYLSNCDNKLPDLSISFQDYALQAVVESIEF